MSRWNNSIFGNRQPIAPVAPVGDAMDQHNAANGGNWFGFGSRANWQREADRLAGTGTSPSRPPARRPAGGCSGRGGCGGANGGMNSEIARKTALLAWQNERNMAATKAGIEAQTALGKKQRTLIKNSGKLLTDFERQEKRRFLEAKKGVGQVSEEDFKLTVEERDKAKAYLAQGSDYWKVKMDEVYNIAKKNTFDNYEKFNFRGR